MVRADSIRWDERYRNRKKYACEAPRPLLYEAIPFLPKSGRVLDIAMGLGANGAFMLQLGYDVVGVDISFIALQEAKRRHPALLSICADLENFSFPASTFDIILNFYYLQRSLWDNIRSWLKPGGILIIETLMKDMQQLKPEIDERFLLSPQELCHSFSDFIPLLYREGWTSTETSHPRAVASFIGRKE